MGNKLFVGNLPFSANDNSLTDVFGRHGTVVSASIIKDRDTGRSKGFAFVEMSSAQEASSALQQLNGSDLDGRALNVSEARPMVPREKSGGGGFSRSNSSRGNW